MSARERLIQRILTSDNPDKLIAIMSEAIEMIQQGKTDREILDYFGITE